MPVNIEIKARAAAWKRQLAAGLALADRTERLRQDDTFFNCAGGRLKLRRQRGAGDYLVFYRRADAAGPKGSSYELVPVLDGSRTLRRFSRLFGVAARVRKSRLVCHAGRTRIHFDEVAGLGRFIELEVVMAEGESAAAGKREARRLMAALGIGKEHLLPCAYADLPRRRRVRPGPRPSPRS